MIVRRFTNKTGVFKVYLIGTRRYAYRLNFRRAKVPDWVVTAMNSIGERAIGFEEETEETRELVTQPTIEDGPIEGEEHDEQDQDERSTR